MLTKNAVSAMCLLVILAAATAGIWGPLLGISKWEAVIAVAVAILVLIVLASVAFGRWRMP